MIRPAAPEDSARWLEIRNDPEARFWSGQRETITQMQHHIWFTKALISKEEGLYVWDEGGVQGYGRIQQVGLVSLAMAPENRGKHAGRQLLLHFTEEAVRVGLPKLLAVIHPSNVASVRAFMRAGYTTHPVSEVVVQKVLL